LLEKSVARMPSNRPDDSLCCVNTVEATDSDISDNLDLEAVASIFGDAKDLEEFEKKLNDPETQISNLDLNEDGEVDYLRVIETSKDNTHLVTIQAVIEKDKYQDVATIDVEKDSKGETQVQVVGDVYMYGPGYIVEPVYVHPPVICVWFWGPLYSPWYSPFYWGFYPPYYHPWHPSANGFEFTRKTGSKETGVIVFRVAEYGNFFDQEFIHDEQGGNRSLKIIIKTELADKTAVGGNIRMGGKNRQYRCFITICNGRYFHHGPAAR